MIILHMSLWKLCTKVLRDLLKSKGVVYGQHSTVQASIWKESLELLDLNHANSTIMSLNIVVFYLSIKFEFVEMVVG